MHTIIAAAIRNRHTALARGAGAILAALGLCVGPALAQEVPFATSIVDDAPSFLAPKGPSADNPLTRPSRDYQGMALGSWMFYPDFIASAVYNDNLLHLQNPRIGATGVRLQPQGFAVRDAGALKTTVYGDLDAIIYPMQPGGDTYNGRLGVHQNWRLGPDLTIKDKLEFDRFGFPTDGGQFATPSGAMAHLISPGQAQFLQAALGFDKSFGRFFVGASIYEVQTIFDPLRTTAGVYSQSYRNSLVSTATERAGYWLTPMLYGFGEVAENWRQYSNDPYTSHGYRSIVGLGSDRISLFRGEVYAGYQTQIYQAPLSGSAASPVFGGKLWWYPTRAWTLNVALDESFSDSANPTPANPRGAPARVTDATETLSYQLSRSWSAHWTNGYQRLQYLGVSEIDNAWSSGLNVKYEISRNIDLTADYAFVRVVSNAAEMSFVNNVVSLGGRYRF